ncbi:unnamed protein product [Durusdinium trenchii]|uniref:Uncharacterized protein n=1 Tax=Durusdinium trenchii TaxID=1381693 RepID=A0ABP0HPS1_9DINO
MTHKSIPVIAGTDGWVPPQLELACPPQASSSRTFFLKLSIVLVGGFGAIMYFAKSANMEWLSSSRTYTAFPAPETQGRSIGRVGTPTELPEVVPRYQAPSLVQF